MVDKVYALAVRYSQLGVGAENILHIRKITAGDPTDAQLLAVANAWKEVLRALQHTTVTWVDWVATQVLGDGVTFNSSNCRQLGGTLQTGALTGTLVGAIGGDALPPSSACAIALGTALRGRPYRTHLSTGGYAETSQNEGLWSVAFNGLIATAVATFLGVYGSGGTDPNFRWCTYSRGLASGCYPNPDLRHHPLQFRAPGNPDVAIANINRATPGTIVSTMRTRLR